MITLDTDNYYSVDDFKDIFEQAQRTGTCKSSKQIEYYNMICAFDIETTSFKDDAAIFNDVYLYNYLKGTTIRVYDVDDIKSYNARCPEVTFSLNKGTYLDEFYDDLRYQWPEWFPETYAPDEMIEYIIYTVSENRTNEDDNKHGIIYCWQLAINGKVIFGREIADFITILKYMEEVTDTKKRIIIYVHNLAYEFQWIRKYITWFKVFAVAPRKPIFAITDGGIEFRCSYVLTNFSLAKLGEQLRHYHINKLVGDLDYSVIRTPLTPMTRTEIQYCMNDVLVVSAYIQECLFKEKHLYNIPYTATGYCRRYTRNKCLYMPGHGRNANKAYRSLIKTLVIDGADEYLQLKRAFQGGFTHCSYLYSGKTMFSADSLDFTSSYPYALLSEQYPMSKGRIVHPESNEDFDKYISLYCCIFDVEFYDLEPSGACNEHYISLSKCWKKEKYVADNGRLERADYILTTLTDVDYKIIKHCYKFSKMVIHNMRVYKKGYLPKELIQSIIKLYKDKTELKGVEGKEQEYLNGKALLNSVYGMMVTDISKEMNVYNECWYVEAADIEKDIARYNHSMKRFLFYPWGVFCTAYARSNLFSGICAFGDDYIYADTDSIKCLHLDEHMDYIENYNRRCKKKLQAMCKYHGIDYDELEPKTIKGVKKPLGVWDHETKGDKYIKFKSLGAKRYLTYQAQDGYHLTVAGVNKHIALPYLLDEYGADVFDHFEQSLIIPEDYTGKLTHVYIDAPDSGIVIDDTGQEYHYTSPTAIYLEKASYCFDIAEDYINYLKGVIIIK